MPNLNISSNNGLVEAKIKTKQETYYLVTEDNLNSIKHKNILSDLFVILASILWGAFFSVIITINSNIGSDNSTDRLLQPLETYKIVFFVAAILFTILAIGSYITSYSQIKKLKEGELEFENNRNK